MARPIPSLRIDLASPVPVYRQIASALRALLVGESFRAGDPLPTVRQLALDLGINHNTVAEAYRILAEEGWLDLRRRSGVTVLPRARPKASRDETATFSRRLEELLAEARARGVPLDALRLELSGALEETARAMKSKEAT